MDLEVDRADLHRTRIVPGRPLPDEPSAGSVLCRIDSFALTANNVTYAVVGEMIGYWRFFPPADEGWGRVPVWGFATVEASSCAGVTPGERLYGYWPMSSHVVLHPIDAGPHGFIDGAPHRADLPAVYNRYQRVSAPADADDDARASLLRPLFTTSFLIDDWLADHEDFGADTVVLASASSKTALGVAHLLKARGVTVIGLTSAPHVGFVESTGAYDVVVAYDDLPAGLGSDAAVYVDMSGDAGVTSAVHRHYADRLRRSVRVGFTHHDAPAAAPADLPGPAPEMFFAPDHVQRRSREWGGAGFAERLDAARAGFDRETGASMRIDRRRGADEVAAAWTEVLDGRADPSTGIICSW